MASVAAATRQPYVDQESLNHALTSDLVGWTVSETREAPLLTHVAPLKWTRFLGPGETGRSV